MHALQKIKRKNLKNEKHHHNKQDFEFSERIIKTIQYTFEISLVLYRGGFFTCFLHYTCFLHFFTKKVEADRAGYVQEN